MKKLCFECKKPAKIEHHIIPKSKGGKNTIPLCYECHSLVHNAKLTSTSELIKKGKSNARNKNAYKMTGILYDKGLPKTEIAKALGISRNVVYYNLKKSGKHIDKKTGCIEVFTPSLMKKIKNMRRHSIPWDTICDTLGISKTHLYRFKRKLKWKNVYVNKNVNRSEYKTLTPQKENLAKKLRRNGMLWQDIAYELGVNIATLYRHGLPKLKIRQINDKT